MYSVSGPRTTIDPVSPTLTSLSRFPTGSSDMPTQRTPRTAPFCTIARLRLMTGSPLTDLNGFEMMSFPGCAAASLYHARVLGS